MAAVLSHADAAGLKDLAVALGGVCAGASGIEAAFEADAALVIVEGADALAPALEAADRRTLVVVVSASGTAFYGLAVNPKAGIVGRAVNAQDIAVTIATIADLPIAEDCTGAIIYQVMKNPNLKLEEIKKLKEGPRPYGVRHPARQPRTLGQARLRISSSFEAFGEGRENFSEEKLFPPFPKPHPSLSKDLLCLSNPCSVFSRDMGVFASCDGLLQRFSGQKRQGDISSSFLFHLLVIFYPCSRETSASETALHATRPAVDPYKMSWEVGGLGREREPFPRERPHLFWT